MKIPPIQSVEHESFTLPPGLFQLQPKLWNYIGSTVKWGLPYMKMQTW